MSERVFLRAVRFHPGRDLPDEYPFTIPAVATLEELHFPGSVTFFAGENGSGKSTVLEAIAAGVGSIPVRGRDARTERTLAHAHVLSRHLRFEWHVKTKRGFFLRAEDFFEYAKHVAGEVEDLGALASDFGERYEGYGRDLATGAVLDQRQALTQRYGEDLNSRSHGESFLQFFRARFTGQGLYLLDEPDTALSAQSVLGLLAMLKAMVSEGAQFIIATHSPLLLALPGASIVSFDRTPVAPVAYEEVEGVALFRDFLSHPKAFLRHL